MKPWYILCGDRGDHLAYMKAVGAWVQASLVIFHEAFELSLTGPLPPLTWPWVSRGPRRPTDAERRQPASAGGGAS
jgi:hypothetical protein